MSKPDLRSECWSILKLTPPASWSLMALFDTDSTFIESSVWLSPCRNSDLALPRSSILPMNLLSKPLYVVFYLKLSLSGITFIRWRFLPSLLSDIDTEVITLSLILIHLSDLAHIESLIPDYWARTHRPQKSRLDTPVKNRNWVHFF